MRVTGKTIVATGGGNGIGRKLVVQWLPRATSVGP